MVELHKHMNISRTLLLSAAALVVGCHSPAAPPAGLALTASVHPAPVVAGQPLSIDVTLTNNTDETYSVMGSAGGCMAGAEVRNARGDLVPNQLGRICDMAAVQHGIGPAGTLVDKLSFSGASPGVYRVRVWMGVIGYETLRSPEYVVTVVAP